jgi:transketolase
MAGELPAETGFDAYIQSLIANPPKVATRKSSEMALEALTAAIPEMVGGSADLTGSNNTKTKSTAPFNAGPLCRPLRLLRHPRIRHGHRDERHGAAAA